MCGVLLLNNEGALLLHLQLKDQTSSEELQTSRLTQAWTETTGIIKKTLTCEAEKNMW